MKPSVGRVARIRLSWWKDRVRALGAASIVRAYRVKASKQPTREGVTVVSANYHSLAQLQVLLKALERYTYERIDILIVDNGSTDGSREFLRTRRDVRSLLLPVNLGHAAALDLGVLAATTATVVTLDVDAFPISSEWLPAVVEPLEKGAVIAGAHYHRAYIHPCFLALRRADFVNHRLSFAQIGHWPHAEVPVAGMYMDVGECLSHKLSVAYGSAAIHKIPVTAIRGVDPIGTVFGDVVYHNFLSTHGPGEDRKLAAETWDEAVREYLN